MTDDKSARGSVRRGLERRVAAAQLEVRAMPDGTGGTTHRLEGYASVYDTPYEMYDSLGVYTERVLPGAGAKTLAENPDVVLLCNHAGLPLARTTNGSLMLSEDSTGLHVAADLAADTSTVRDVVASVEAGLVTEMSFAFRVIRQQWSPDWEQRGILEYDISRGDVSVVTMGANPATTVALRAADLLGILDHLDDHAAADVYARLGHRLTRAVDVSGLSLAAARSAALRRRHARI